MFFRDCPLCCLAVVGIAFAAIPEAAAQLAAKSPFLPAPAAGAAAPAANVPIEYKGYMETSEGRLFRIYDPAKKTRTWVKLNERNQEFDVLVKQHDSAKGTLTIEHQGKVYSLEEPKSKVVSSGAPPPMPPPMPSNVPTAVTQAVVLNPTPADEQRRLDAVAAEVQRRRALREQAAQQVNPAMNSQVVVPQPIQPQVQPQPNVQPGQRLNPPFGGAGAQPR